MRWMVTAIGSVAMFLFAGCEVGEINVDDILEDAVFVNIDDYDEHHHGDCDIDADADADADVDTDADTDADTDEVIDILSPDENGWVDGSTNNLGIQGGWFTATDVASGGDSTIDLKIMSHVGVCVSGTVSEVLEEEMGTYWGALIGLSLCTDYDEEITYNIGECPQDLSSIIGFVATIESYVQPMNEIRVMFGETGRSEPAYISVFDPFVSGEFLFSDAEVGYDPSAPGVTPSEVEQLIFQIPTTPGAQTEFDFCVYDIMAITSPADCVTEDGTLCII